MSAVSGFHRDYAKSGGGRKGPAAPFAETTVLRTNNMIRAVTRKKGYL